MKTILISLSFILISFGGYSSVLKPNIESNNEPANHFALKIPITADPCLDAALNAQAQAFAIETSGWSWCADVHSTGQGFTDCANAFTAMRQQMVAYIQSTFVPCPSGNGNGIIALNNSLNRAEIGKDISITHFLKLPISSAGKTAIAG